MTEHTYIRDLNCKDNGVPTHHNVKKVDTGKPHLNHHYLNGMMWWTRELQCPTCGLIERVWDCNYSRI